MEDGFDKGSLVWVPEDSEEAFVPAIVTGVKDKVISIEYSEDAKPKAPSKKDFDQTKADEVIRERVEGNREVVSEMDELPMLNSATVLANIDELYRANTIYSSVGPVLIAMNPFKNLSIYGEEYMKAYHNAGTDVVELKKLGPHAYRTAEEAYQGLKRRENQAIVICGESGAGKTVTNRKMLEMLCEVAKPSKKTSNAGADPQKITMANELLESFGNASTTRNHNSSRFGKLTTLQFADDFTVVGCGVQSYLLERSRVVGVPKDERNFHIFYQLLRSDRAEKYHFEPSGDPEKRVKAYEITKGGAELKAPEVYGEGNNDKTDFEAVRERMTKVGFDDALQDELLGTLAACLHIGNVKVSDSHDAACVDTDSHAFQSACKLLGLKPEGLAFALTHKVIKDPKTSKDTISAVGRHVAIAQLNTLAKLIYSRNFDTIVQAIDHSMNKDGRVDRFIGLLDIFGFEDMANNGFEQMFINLTNERIQQLFNEIIFEREKQVYLEDGLNPKDFDFPAPTNDKCVQLFLGSGETKTVGGILGYLTNQVTRGLKDEEVDGANFVKLLNNYCGQNYKYQTCGFMDVHSVLKRKGLLKKGETNPPYQEHFLVKHYAGDILYRVQDFVPKSRDSFPAHLGDVMRASSKEYVKDLFPQDIEGKSTVGQKFYEQLKDLAGILQGGETLFVRCIKPNQKMKPGIVDRRGVYEQLKNGGVMAALAMRRQGLPERMGHTDFIQKFWLLRRPDTVVWGPRVRPGEAPPISGSTLKRMGSRGGSASHLTKSKCENILINVFGSQAKEAHEFAIGDKQVFMKSHVMTRLQWLVKVRTQFLLRRIKRKLDERFVKKIDYALSEMQRAEKQATDDGLKDLPVVQKALSEAKKLIEPLYKALDECRKRHSSNKDKSSSSVVKLNELAERLKLAEIALKEQMNKARESSSSVVELLNKLAERLKLAESALSELISRSLQEIDLLLDKVASIEQDCNECEDVASEEELKTCRDECAQARSQLLKLQNTTLPTMKLQSTTLEKLANDKWSNEVKDIIAKDSNVDRMLQDVRKLVAQAEATSEAVLPFRKFDEAVAELAGARAAADMRLQDLQEFAKKCINVGYKELADIISKAGEMLALLELEKRDAASYREKFAAYETALGNAEKAVKAGKQELARREEELRKRRELRAQLESQVTRLKNALEEDTNKFAFGAAHDIVGSQVKLARAEILNLQKESLNLINKEESVSFSDWNNEVADLCPRVQQAIDELAEVAAKDREARDRVFKQRLSVFGAGINARVPDTGRKRTSLGNSSDAAEQHEEPKAFIQSLGLDGKATALLQDLERNIEKLKSLGVAKSTVTSVVKESMKFHYPEKGFGTPQR